MDSKFRVKYDYNENKFKVEKENRFNMDYEALLNKNRGYGINYQLLANELGKIIKDENILVLTDEINHLKRTFQVRFCLVGENDELFCWNDAKNIPRIGEQVTNCNVGGKRNLYEIQWFTVREIFHLSDSVVVCTLSPYKPLSPEQPDKPFKRI